MFIVGYACYSKSGNQTPQSKKNTDFRLGLGVFMVALDRFFYFWVAPDIYFWSVNYQVELFTSLFTFTFQLCCAVKIK